MIIDKCFRIVCTMFIVCANLKAANSVTEADHVMGLLRMNENIIDGFSIKYLHSTRKGSGFEEYFKDYIKFNSSSHSKSDIEILKNFAQLQINKDVYEALTIQDSSYVRSVLYQNSNKEWIDEVYGTNGEVYFQFDQLNKKGILDSSELAPLGLRTFIYPASNIAVMFGSDSPVKWKILDEFKKAANQGGAVITSDKNDKLTVKTWTESKDFKGKYCVGEYHFDLSKSGALTSYKVVISDSKDMSGECLPYALVKFSDFLEVTSGKWIPKVVEVTEFTRNSLIPNDSGEDLAGIPMSSIVKGYIYATHHFTIQGDIKKADESIDYLKKLPPGSVMDDKISGCVYTSKSSIQKLKDEISTFRK